MLFRIQTSILTTENFENSVNNIEHEGSDDVFYDCGNEQLSKELDSSSSTNQETTLKCKNRLLSTIIKSGIEELIDRVLTKSLGFSKDKEKRKEEIKERTETNWCLFQQIIKKYEEIKIEEIKVEKKSTITEERIFITEDPKYSPPDRKLPEITEYKPLDDEVEISNQQDDKNIVNKKRISFAVIGACLFIISTLAYLLLRTCGKMGMESLLRIYVLITFYLALYIFFFK